MRSWRCNSTCSAATQCCRQADLSCVTWSQRSGLVTSWFDATPSLRHMLPRAGIHVALLIVTPCGRLPGLRQCMQGRCDTASVCSQRHWLDCCCWLIGTSTRCPS
jgi:hypothetical protein